MAAIEKLSIAAFFMSNHWFQFRKFLINQSNSAMKVGTDSLILGSWVKPPSEGLILDIGAGTGLLSLMMAQVSNSTIHAVEINPDACLDAKLNFEASPWRERLQLHTESIQSFIQKLENSILQFDLILSNPPYFVNSLTSVNENRNQARHDSTMTRYDLLQAASRLLSESGSFHLILPFEQGDSFRNLAALAGLHEYSRLIIRPTSVKPPNRIVLSFQKIKRENTIESITVREDGCYSNDYLRLCHDFYSDDFLKKNRKKT